MIPTRIHGVVDYLVSALLAALAGGGRFSPRVRQVLGSAGAYHTSYSVLTEYEAGLVPLVSMRRHLALDAIGAAAICGAGLLLRNESRRERALLVGIGLAEFLVIALSDPRPGRAA